MNDNQIPYNCDNLKHMIRPDLEERIKKIISDGPVLIEIPWPGHFWKLQAAEINFFLSAISQLYDSNSTPSPHQLFEQLRLWPDNRPFWDFNEILGQGVWVINRPHDFDDFESIDWLFSVLRSRWYLWDFDSITAPMPPHIPIVACMYEYHRSTPQSVYLTGHPGRLALVAKLSRDFPEWPATPYIFTNPCHVAAFAYRGWSGETSPLVQFSFDPSLPQKEVLKICAAQWKENHIPHQTHVGSGSPDRQACRYLKWLGHSRLWTGIRYFTQGWKKASDLNRFESIYKPFLRDGMPDTRLFAYKNLQKLQVAIRKSNWLLRNVLAQPLSN
jgi:hypothetical protein